MKPEWIDEGLRGSELKLGTVVRTRIVVTRHRDFPKDAWVLYCPGVIENRELMSKDLDVAKREAVLLVDEYLRQAHAPVKAYADEMMKGRGP